MAIDVAFETVVSARTSGTAGTATVGTIFKIGTMPLYACDEILIYIVTTQNLAGTTPTMDLYFQQGVVPEADPATDASWDDWAKATQLTATLGVNQVLLWAVKAGGVTSTNNTSGTKHDRGIEQAGFTAGNMFQNHPGDRLRIREVMGGTVTTPAIYNIHARGVRFY